MSLKPLGRPVSIVGISNLPQGLTTSVPEFKDLSMYEMYAWACQSALEDAGIKACDVDKVVHGQVANYITCGNSISQHTALAEWVGIQGKPVVHHEEACSTGYVTFDEAVTSVASGRYDIVLATSVEISPQFFNWNQPAHMLHPMSQYPNWWIPTVSSNEPGYYRFNGISTLFDEGGRLYTNEYGLSVEQMDDVYNMIAINDRRNAVRNPQAFCKKEYVELAREKGYDDVMAYMRSNNNPRLTPFVRMSGVCVHTNAAAAIVVCASDIAKSFKQKPIEVLNSAIVPYTVNVPYSFHRMNVEAANTVYESSGVRPEEIDYLQTTDMTTGEHLDSAEAVGYLPKGQGWKYIMEGRTAFDGDKPINTNGGDLSAGHAYSTCGLISIAETVIQMRGQGGERQMKKIPHTAMVRGMGGGHTTVATILRSQD